MDRELNELVMLERVEMIARLTADGVCQEKDREIALNLIAELAKENLLKSNSFSVVFSAKPIQPRLKRENEVRIQITLDTEQSVGEHILQVFENELNYRVKSAFPSSHVKVKKGSMSAVEIKGLPSDSDREKLDTILKEVWEDVSFQH